MPFIDHSSEKWGRFLKLTDHDLYHLPRYVTADALITGGKAIAWIPDEVHISYLIPLIKRSIKYHPAFDNSIHTGKPHDLISPYGYPGILTKGFPEPAHLESTIGKFHEEAAAEGFISTFIRLDPVRNQWFIAERDYCRQEFPGATLSVDTLHAGNWKHVRGNLGRDLKGIWKRGIRTTVNEWNRMDDFIEAYGQTMRRKEAQPYYHFKKNYFDSLTEAAAGHLVMISVITENGDYLGGGIFTLFGKIMQYHLSAVTDAAIRMSPAKLLLHEAILYASNHGASLLHLGGGKGGNCSDGLYAFKRRFATHQHPFSCLKFIHNQPIYNRLCNGIISDFFPGYRYNETQNSL